METAAPAGLHLERIRPGRDRIAVPRVLSDVRARAARRRCPAHACASSDPRTLREAEHDGLADVRAAQRLHEAQRRPLRCRSEQSAEISPFQRAGADTELRTTPGFRGQLW